MLERGPVIFSMNTAKDTNIKVSTYTVTVAYVFNLWSAEMLLKFYINQDINMIKGFFSNRHKCLILWTLSASFEYPCYGSYAIIKMLLFQCGGRLYTAESDVYRRQNLTFKVDPRAVRVSGISRYMFRFDIALLKRGIVCVTTIKMLTRWSNHRH